MKRRRQRGNMILETVLLMPFFLLILVGMVQISKISYTYYQLKKALSTAAEFVATQQGVNLCDDADETIVAAKNLALTGTVDGSADVFFRNLSADQVQVRAERYDSSTDQISDACDGTSGALPNYIVVSIPEGYQFPLRIPYLLIDPLLLRPVVKTPFRGTGGVSE